MGVDVGLGRVVRRVAAERLGRASRLVDSNVVNLHPRRPVRLKPIVAGEQEGRP